VLMGRALAETGRGGYLFVIASEAKQSRFTRVCVSG
jgi:hypothetical protein